MNEFHLILGKMTGNLSSLKYQVHPAFICLFLSAIRESHYNYNRSDLKSVNISVITVTSSQTMRCYVGNCTSLEDCRREELISDCSSRDYDACITTIVQKGTVTSERETDKLITIFSCFSLRPGDCCEGVWWEWELRPQWALLVAGRLWQEVWRGLLHLHHLLHHTQL